ncbi:MAG: hypothetical protein HY866_21300 [Chloroflexi bacterium]|nr:hypothetical protein [Chloroflexota bacterium]
MRKTLFRALRRLITLASRITMTLLLVVLLNDGVTYDLSLRGRVNALAKDVVFDYVSWEIDALWDKARQELFGVYPYLDETEQRAALNAFLDTLGEAQTLEAQIARFYTDPAVSDPAAASADLRAERDDLRRELSGDQALVEGIIEEQVSAVLIDEGFGVLGQVIPPVWMHFSELPAALIVSPRDRIESAAQLTLNPIPVDEREALETHIDAELNTASIVVSLGGLSLYPSMIEEPDYPPADRRWNLARAFEVTGHEWAHNYLMASPLGLEYDVRAETRIINETTATFFGRAVAREVMRRYYAEFPAPDYPSFLGTAADPIPVAVIAEPARDPDAPLPFDYYREMNRTRIQVDFMLWQGNISGAERYMEARRRLFVANGYRIRKLNQAYFAFYGGYQGEPGSGGSDPIGPAIEELLLLSPDLESWLNTMRPITTRDQLLAALDTARRE